MSRLSVKVGLVDHASMIHDDQSRALTEACELPSVTPVLVG